MAWAHSPKAGFPTLTVTSGPASCEDSDEKVSTERCGSEKESEGSALFTSSAISHADPPPGSGFAGCISGIYQGLWGLRGGCGSLSEGVSTKKMTFELEFEGKAVHQIQKQNKSTPGWGNLVCMGRESGHEQSFGGK